MLAKMIALDWRAMKVYQIRGLLLPVFAFLFGLFSPLLVIPMTVYMYLSYSINPFAVEEKGELNNLYLTLPVSRKEIVTGRYLLSFLMMLVSMAIGALVMPVANQFSVSKWFIGLEGYIAVIALSYLLYAILNLFMFPILFRLGYQKGKFWGFYLPAILFAFLCSAYISFTTITEYKTLSLDLIRFASENLLVVSGSMAVLATIILIISYLIYLKLYAKRDF